MYPYIRFTLGRRRARMAPPIGPFDTHVSHHVCWPWDLDPWAELNNGRTLTLYDLGRIPMAIRSGLAATVQRQGWGMTVAGVSVRYRRRIRPFQRFVMLSRLVGWDARFLYMTQSLWKGGDCANEMLMRWAVTAEDGIVTPDRVAAAHGGMPAESPPLPAWIAAWIAAEAGRPWPPEVLPDAEAALRPGAVRA